METKLFNKDPDGFTSDISLGGLPIFTNDLQMIQDNSTELYGTLGLLKGWSCILRGCYVDFVNVDSKTVTVTEGIVLINDTIYFFPGVVDSPYPFSIIKGSEVVDQRIFKDGGFKDVAITFSSAIRTSFTFGVASTSLESITPIDLTESEIYFDPFTAQRAENILANLANPRGFLRPLGIESVITKSETNKTNIGILNYLTGDGEGRWKHFGWQSLSDQEDMVLRNSGTGAPAPGIKGGANTITLANENLPQHIHDSGNLQTGKEGTSSDVNIGNGDIHNSGEHNHVTRTSSGKRVTSGSFPNMVVIDHQVASDNDTLLNSGVINGGHIHKVFGKTGTGDGLNGVAFDIKNFGLYVNYMNWVGYSEHSSFYKFNTGVLPISNM